MERQQKKELFPLLAKTSWFIGKILTPFSCRGNRFDWEDDDPLASPISPFTDLPTQELNLSEIQALLAENTQGTLWE